MLEPLTQRALALVRLTPEDPDAWRRWPILEARIRGWVPTLSPRTDPEQVVLHARKLFATAPLYLGAWLGEIVPENGTGPHVVAHYLGWVMTDQWGESTLFVYHACVNPGESAHALWGPFVAALDAWRGDLNRAAGREWIRYARFFTERSSPAWERLLGHFALTESIGTVVSVDLTTRLQEPRDG